ncbi:DUF4123 domain-containing protein [Pseudomonas sp. Ant30-3]|uniref:DUF4123 domain-containing protein n=1 Tax=Pseudomonas sp. Ant30-3 TaxID=1488328 RepID=UPI00048E7DCF|nr:DUF4123 domain-containing protein [Pseudomonas sp. Ant30-3]
MKLSFALPADLPWSRHHACLLFDGTAVPDLPTRLKQLSASVNTVALYDSSLFKTLRDISPLLVAIQGVDDPVFQFYLEQAEEEWAVLLFSHSPALGVAQHLRKLLTVALPEGQQVALRLADAAVANALFASADQCLFGPLSCVVVADCVNATWHRHQPRQPQPPELPTPYRLSHELNAALDDVDHRRVLLDLDAHLLKHFPERHLGAGIAQRWPRLQQLQVQASTLGLSSQSELFYYANLMTWLNTSTLKEHPDIARLLHSPSLQPLGERIALAANLAERKANTGGHP